MNKEIEEFKKQARIFTYEEVKKSCNDDCIRWRGQQKWEDYLNGKPVCVKRGRFAVDCGNSSLLDIELMSDGTIQEVYYGNNY